MKKYVALLRGINVSGQKKIKMAELREWLSDAGLLSVQTYIQSGNIVFESDQSESQTASLIEAAILKASGFEVPTLVLPQDFLKDVIAGNPFLESIDDEKKLYVCFLLDEVTPEGMGNLKTADLGGDEYRIVDRVIYTCYHQGMGKTKMDNNFLEKRLKVRATSRNWRTVNILSEY